MGNIIAFAQIQVEKNVIAREIYKRIEKKRV